MSIYTRTGDDGTTRDFSGKRLAKSDPRIKALGAVDELNSAIGFLTSQIKSEKEADFLRKIQKDLLYMSSLLAGRAGDQKELALRIRQMEKQIDDMEKSLPQLTRFILPGGSAAGASAHLARSICRRVECQVVGLFVSQSDDFPKSSTHGKSIIGYLNRLSDYLFVLARRINQNDQAAEIIWLLK